VVTFLLTTSILSCASVLSVLSYRSVTASTAAHRRNGSASRSR
jgi:hypothetical protein